MEWREQNETVKMDAIDSVYTAHIDSVYPTLDDSIQLQSPESIALNGLLSDLEFMAERYQSMSELHWFNYKDGCTFSGYTKQQSYTAFGIYSNKAQDMRDLVNRWKPNKK